MITGYLYLMCLSNPDWIKAPTIWPRCPRNLTLTPRGLKKPTQEETPLPWCSRPPMRFLLESWALATHLLCISSSVVTHHWHLTATERIISSMLSSLSSWWPTKIPSILPSHGCNHLISHLLQHCLHLHCPLHWRSSLLCTPVAWLQSEAVPTHLLLPKSYQRVEDRRNGTGTFYITIFISISNGQEYMYLL